MARAGIDLYSMLQETQDEALEPYLRQQLACHFPRKVGVVYAAEHAAFPGLVKIGMSRRDPNYRIAELTTSGIPGTFTLLGYVTALDSAAVEAKVHQALDAYRTERELFRASPELALSTMQLVAGSEFQMLARRLGRLLPDLVLPAYLITTAVPQGPAS